MAVSKRLRFEILRRDNHACRYCGRSAPDARLTIDHVVPTALGGSDDPSNLVTACADCNGGKTSMPADAPIVADVAADALRWANAMKRAAELATQHRDQMIQIEGAVLDYWKNEEVPYRPNETFADYLPGDWYLSVQRWISAGLTVDDLTDACHITIYARRIKARDAWRYMCGVCWRMLTERQEAARTILDAEEAALTQQRLEASGRLHPLSRAPEYLYAMDSYEAVSAVCDGALA